MGKIDHEERRFEDYETSDENEFLKKVEAERGAGIMSVRIRCMIW